MMRRGCLFLCFGTVQGEGALPPCTYFTPSAPNAIEDFLQDFHSEFPDALEDKREFLQRVERAYDEFMHCGGKKRLGYENLGTAGGSPGSSSRSAAQAAAASCAAGSVGGGCE